MLITTESRDSHWPLGKVVEVYPGKDDHFRSVKLQVGEMQLVRLIENSVHLNWTNYESHCNKNPICMWRFLQYDILVQVSTIIRKGRGE